MFNLLSTSSRTLYIFRVARVRQRVFRFTRHTLSTAGPHSSREATPKDRSSQWAVKLRPLFKPVEHHLHRGEHSLALSSFYEGLRMLKPENPQLFRIYEEGISLFLRHNHPLSAAMIYSRMTTRGFIPSISIRVQMRVVKLADTFPDESLLLEELEAAFKQPSYTEDALRDLLHLLAGFMQCTPAFIDHVVRVFVGARTNSSKLKKRTIALLARIHANAGSVAVAQNWIAVHEVASSQPHTDLLNTLISVDSHNKEAYRWIVEHMKSNNIRADLAFYNVTLALWVSHERLVPVFELYRILRQSKPLTLTPDAYTYGILFGVLRKWRWDRRRRRRVARKVSLPDSAPSSRCLFREMIECHLRHTEGRMTETSRVLTLDVLEQALRTFMVEEDFVAACVVIHFLRTLKFDASLDAYRIVVARIVRRISRETKLLDSTNSSERYWAVRFLGSKMCKKSDDELSLDEIILEIVLRFGTAERLSLDDVPSPQGSNEAIYSMPSIPVFLGIEPSDPQDIWSYVPLERILCRAVLAEPRFPTSTPAQEVASNLMEARADMFPAQGVSQLEMQSELMIQTSTSPVA